METNNEASGFVWFFFTNFAMVCPLALPRRKESLLNSFRKNRINHHDGESETIGF